MIIFILFVKFKHNKNLSSILKYYTYKKYIINQLTIIPIVVDPSPIKPFLNLLYSNATY